MDGCLLGTLLARLLACLVGKDEIGEGDNKKTGIGDRDRQRARLSWYSIAALLPLEETLNSYHKTRIETPGLHYNILNMKVYMLD